MSTPRAPGDPYDRDPYGRDPDAGEGVPTWGRAPAGGWGADPGDDRYGAGYGDPEYDAEYGAADWDAPVRDVQPRYGQRLDRLDSEPAAGRRGRSGRRPADRHAARGARSGPAWAPGAPTAVRRPGSARRRPPWVAVGVGAAAVIAFLVLGFGTPGWFVTRVFDADAVQAGIVKILADDYATDGVTDVRCPERVEVVPDATFTCDAAIDSDPVKVPVRVTDAKGGYEVGRPTSAAPA